MHYKGYDFAPLYLPARVTVRERFWYLACELANWIENEAHFFQVRNSHRRGGFPGSRADGWHGVFTGFWFVQKGGKNIGLARDAHKFIDDLRS